jgi:hypothetical protein
MLNSWAPLAGGDAARRGRADSRSTGPNVLRARAGLRLGSLRVLTGRRCPGGRVVEARSDLREVERLALFRLQPESDVLLALLDGHRVQLAVFVCGTGALSRLACRERGEQAVLLAADLGLLDRSGRLRGLSNPVSRQAPMLRRESRSREGRLARVVPVEEPASS